MKIGQLLICAFTKAIICKDANLVNIKRLIKNHVENGVMVQTFSTGIMKAV
jgi:hypothetical protein